ncbi:MAG: acyltransferase family protein [Pseudomonadota bacterium]
MDGLRAVAVVPVILFHAGFEAVPGGFVGVDVFFVISGFLITGIILDDLERERFSLWNFYERRARRILPALLLVMLVCVPVSWFTMMPDPLENFGQSVVATLLFSNNILLWMTTGYWDLAGEFKPLLHTWSLAVEEQYYIIFPLLALAAWRLGPVTFGVIFCVLAIGSFWAAEITRVRDPAAAFYLLHARAWELLIGAIGLLVQRRHRPKASDLAAGLGIVAILASVLLFDETTPFPSAYTLIPTVGTVLVLLFADVRSLVGRLLSLRIFVGIGLISYSLYLWHQPVFAFARVMSTEEPTWATFCLLIPLVFVLAAMTWKFVEQPARRRQVAPLPAFATVAALISAAMVALGLAFHNTSGFPQRLYPMSENVSAGLHISYNEAVRRFQRDAFVDAGRPKVLVLGNSHGRDFTNVLVEGLGEDQLNIIYRDDFFACLAQRNLSQEAEDLLLEADIVFFAGDGVNLNCIDEDITWLEAEGASVFVVGPKQFGYNLNVHLRVSRDDRHTAMNPVFRDVLEVNEVYARHLAPNHYIDLLSILGDDLGFIRVFDDDGFLISSDRVHLTQYGARFVGELLFTGDGTHTVTEALAVSHSE